ncbi:MAG: hypothetical protein IPK07_28180 [Deltaproteobacteria bacterium]|nr:hypothetical protein [Deltaproteobacteria bacterium]
MGALAGTTRPPLKASLWLGAAAITLIAVLGIWQGTNEFAVRGTIVVFCYLTGMFGAFLLGRIAGDRTVIVDVAVVLAVLVLVAGMCGIRNVSVHYLLTNQYYPYPKPTHYVARAVGMIAAWVVSGVLAGILGSRIALLVRSTERLYATLAALAIGLAAGGVASYFAHQAINPYRTIVVWGVLAIAALAARRTVALAVGAVVLLAVGLGSEKITPAPFVWRLADYKIRSQHWTPYYKLDFVSFNGDTCMGGVYDNLMLWYHCQDPDKLPREISTVFRVAGEGRKSALAIGRTDSMYLSLLEKWHGPLERTKSLEYDQTVVDQVTGPYSRYFNDRFRKPGHTAVAGDLKRLIHEEKEKYDIIFLNGQMIRLYLHPRTLIPQEDYLFDRDTITDMVRLLNPGGLLVIDWGSSQEVELYDAWSNLPEGTYASAFWTTLSNLPMSGLPLFFMFVSPDPAVAEPMAARIEALGMDRERSRAVGVDPAKMTPTDTDDRPFLQWGLSISYAVMPVPLVLLLGTVTWRLARHARALGAAPRVIRRLGAPAVFVAVGLLSGFLETLVVGRLSRADAAGVPMGAALLWPFFALGFVAPCVLRLGDASIALRRVGALAAAGAAGAGLALAVVLDGSLPAMVVASSLLGTAVATLVVATVGGLGGEARGQEWGLVQLGAVLGLALFQTLVFVLGFQGLSIALAVFAVGVGAAATRLLPSRPAEGSWVAEGSTTSAPRPSPA